MRYVIRYHSLSTVNGQPVGDVFALDVGDISPGSWSYTYAPLSATSFPSYQAAADEAARHHWRDAEVVEVDPTLPVYLASGLTRYDATDGAGNGNPLYPLGYCAMSGHADYGCDCPELHMALIVAGVGTSTVPGPDNHEYDREMADPTTGGSRWHK